MKKFINKISKGSTFALFLEILLLIQIIFFTYRFISISTDENTVNGNTVNEYPGHIEIRGDK